MTSAVTSGGTATTMSDGASSADGGAAGAVVDREAQLRGRRVVERDVDAAGHQGMPDARAEQAGADDAHGPRNARCDALA